MHWLWETIELGSILKAEESERVRGGMWQIMELSSMWVMLRNGRGAGAEELRQRIEEEGRRGEAEEHTKKVTQQRKGQRGAIIH